MTCPAPTGKRPWAWYGQASLGMVMTEGSAEFKRGIQRRGNRGGGWRHAMSGHSNLNGCAMTGDDVVF
jgi:hypothetical protein